MTAASEKTNNKIDVLYCWWNEYKNRIIFYTLILMSAIAVLRLGYEFWRLLLASDPNGANDLRMRFEEVRWWFSGEQMYKKHGCTGYPPASYIALGLLLGWTDFNEARWIWAVSAVIALGALIPLIVKQSKAENRLERTFWILTLLSAYPIPVTIGNGQLGVHLLPALIGGILLLDRNRRVSWHQDILSASLLIAALTKPSISAPFILIALISSGRLRPIIFVFFGYMLLTIIAASFQSDPLWILFQFFFESGSAAAVKKGGAHIGKILNDFGISLREPVIPFAILGFLGIWLFLNRKADMWIQLGVTGIVARIWTYHRMYDDLLIFLPMIALFRILKEKLLSIEYRMTAGIFFTIAWLGLLMPATLARLDFPLSLFYDIGQTVVWLTILMFLIFYSRRYKKAVLAGI